MVQEFIEIACVPHGQLPNVDVFKHHNGCPSKFAGCCRLVVTTRLKLVMPMTDKVTMTPCYHFHIPFKLRILSDAELAMLAQHCCVQPTTISNWLYFMQSNITHHKF